MYYNEFFSHFDVCFNACKRNLIDVFCNDEIRKCVTGEGSKCMQTQCNVMLFNTMSNSVFSQFEACLNAFERNLIDVSATATWRTNSYMIRSP